MIKKKSIYNKQGFTLIELIITLVVAAILGAMFVNYMGPNLIGSSITTQRTQDHYELIGIVEKINADYIKLMQAGDTNVLVTLQSRISAGDYGQYSQATKFITFNSSNVEESSATPGSNTLKVTITKNDQTVTTIFTK